MIRYTKGDMLQSNAEALVNTVNTMGVMGKGIALQFKETFPENFRIYAEACRHDAVAPGKLLITRDRDLAGRERIIVNFPTKKHWRYPSRYEYIADGLKELARIIPEQGIRSIAIPPLGCGNGRLEWTKVKPMIENALGGLDIDIVVFEPDAGIKQELQKRNTNKEIHLTPARGLLAYAMFYYDSLGENCSLFVANKLAYFLQRVGVRSFSRIKFTASYYGPYSQNIAHLVYDLNGSYIKGFEQMNAAAFEPLKMQYDRIKEVSEYVRTLDEKDQKGLKDMIALVSGFESTLALEILASVDFVRREHPGISLEDATDAVHNWTERKNRLFKDEYIKIAYEHIEAFDSRGQGSLSR